MIQLRTPNLTLTIGLLWAAAGCRDGYDVLLTDASPGNGAGPSADSATTAGATSRTTTPTESGGASSGGGTESGTGSTSATGSSAAADGAQGEGGSTAGRPGNSGGVTQGVGGASSGAGSGAVAMAGAGSFPGSGGASPGTCFDVSGCTCDDSSGRRYFYCEGPLDPLAAGIACGLLGSLVVQIGSGAENEMARRGAIDAGLLSESGSIIVGGSDLAQEGVWRWANLSVYWDGGATGEYENWGTAPTDDTLDCMAMERDGTWIEIPCDLAGSFICEQF